MPHRALSALLLVSAACSSPTKAGTTVDELIGDWVTQREALRPAGAMEHQLRFTAAGRFAATVRTTGLYPGQHLDEFSAYSTTVGSYRVNGDRLDMRPDSLLEWDRFHGANSPVTIHAPYPYGTTLYDDARFTLDGRVLTLIYTTYPADAPVPTSQRFYRLP
jgi:hypothetical protein